MEASLCACAIPTFPCVHLLLVHLYWFPLTLTLHSPPCKWGLGELTEKRNMEKAGHRQVRVNWNSHSCYSTLPKAVQFTIHMSTSTAFTDKNYHMRLQFHFLPWVGNLRWWKPEPVLLYFFFWRPTQLSPRLFLCYDGMWSWGSI